MTALPFADADAAAIPLVMVAKDALGADAGWAAVNGFSGDAGILVVPDGSGGIARVLVGTGADAPDRDFWAIAGLSESLPEGTYKLAEEPAEPAATRMALGWALGSYVFDRYKKRKRASARLVWPAAAHRARVEGQAGAIHASRDLINTPAGDLLPSGLAAAAEAAAKEFGAEFSVIVGDDLLARNYPAVHAVGRASADAPRLIDIRWGDPSHPKVTLVGKGVCFDSGGLDIKPASGMLMMKKDMGGAANVLAIARMVMTAKFPVRLRVLIPAVENAISGNAFRPWDVLQTRKGLTVEVGNTDAEGRLILCDALAEADSEKPALLIDCATLTGAARVALGPELPVLFTRHDDLADQLLGHGVAEGDPLWRLPLHAGYRRSLDSKVADISSTGDSAYNGAITAALFLAEFVSPETRWAHIDMMAWNTKTRPGRPEGGEAQAARAVFELIRSVK